MAGPPPVRFRPTAPLKGSFPLDREARCKQTMEAYMECLRTRSQYTSECLNVARRYFECRMANDLMETEDFGRLGFSDEKKTNDAHGSSAT